jgi:hypothetical protein
MSPCKSHAIGYQLPGHLACGQYKCGRGMKRSLGIALSDETWLGVIVNTIEVACIG